VNKALDGENSLKLGYEVIVKQASEIDPYISDLLASADEFIEKETIQGWLEEHTQKKEGQIFLRDASGLDHTLADVGVGLSQAIPFIVAGCQATAGSAIAIEQPELHIHPASQSGIGDVLARSVNETNREVLYLIETHSEHILLRLLRRIREGSEGDNETNAPRVEPHDLSVNYVESKNGRSIIKRLRVDTDGDFIDRWPNGFFEERYDELF
jgi:predicted ATPase